MTATGGGCVRRPRGDRPGAPSARGPATAAPTRRRRDVETPGAQDRPPPTSGAAHVTVLGSRYYVETWTRSALHTAGRRGLAPPSRSSRPGRRVFRSRGPARPLHAPPPPGPRSRASAPPAAPCPPAGGSRGGGPRAGAQAPAMWDPRAIRCVRGSGRAGEPPAWRASRRLRRAAAARGGGGGRRPLRRRPGRPRAHPGADPGLPACLPRGVGRGAAPAFRAPGDEGTRCDRAAGARGRPRPRPGTEAAAPGPAARPPEGTPGPPPAPSTGKPRGRAPGHAPGRGAGPAGNLERGRWQAAEPRGPSPGQASCSALHPSASGAGPTGADRGRPARRPRLTG